MKKADGWSMGQGEQKKKALEEKLRRRAYTAAFEAAQQRKEKPWQSWDGRGESGAGAGQAR